MNADRQCSARSKRSGERCKRAAIRGGKVCSFHGGKVPSVKAAAARRVALKEAEADARAVLGWKAADPVRDPVLELAKVAAEIGALKDALSQRVNALSSPTSVDAMGVERVRVEVDLYGQALDRTVKVLDLLGKHDLEVRRVKLAEQDARVIAWILQGFLVDLALPDEARADAEDTMRRWVTKAAEVVNVDELPS